MCGQARLADVSRSHSDKLPPVGPFQQRLLSDPRWCADSEADEHSQPKPMRWNAIIENRVSDSNDPPLELTLIHPYPTAGQSDALLTRWRQLNGKRREENLTISIWCATPSNWMLNKLLSELEQQRAQTLAVLDECESKTGELR